MDDVDLSCTVFQVATRHSLKALNGELLIEVPDDWLGLSCDKVAKISIKNTSAVSPTRLHDNVMIDDEYQNSCPIKLAPCHWICSAVGS